MAKSMGSKDKGLAKLVEEKAFSKKLQEEERQRLTPYLPKDCISNILIRLPHDSLLRSMLVCKCWNHIIKSPNFVHSYLYRSESVLIFQTESLKPRFYSVGSMPLPPEKPNSFSVEANYYQSKNVPVLSRPSIDPLSKSCIKFMEIGNGKSEVREYNISCLGKIRATCDGLILLDDKLEKTGLIVLNPVTRKLVPLLYGTLCAPHKESYGFASSKTSGEQKVVHLFRDDSEYFHCEILSLRTRIWRGVSGPDAGLFSWLGYRPVSAIGSLHWVPHIDHSDYIVSVEVDNEKFHKISLPKGCRSHDRLLEMHGSLSFITNGEINQIEVWMLGGIYGHAWRKMHTIFTGCTVNMIPLASLKVKGDIILACEEDSSLFRYDFKLQSMSKIEVEEGHALPRSSYYFPHVNSFISW